MSMIRSNVHACARVSRALVLLTVAACGAESGLADSDPLASIEPDPGVIDAGGDVIDARVALADGGAADGGDAGAMVRDPRGAYIANIQANGTGCPSGAWNAYLSADGKGFAVTFSEFYVEVDRSRAVSIKNCQLSLSLHSPANLSFSVGGVTLAGYMYLEDGVQVRLQTHYYFMGYPNAGETVSSDTVGPQDKEILVQDTREDLNMVWSRCGTDQTLNVNLTLRLLNSESPRRNGFVSLSELPERSLAIYWRRC